MSLNVCLPGLVEAGKISKAQAKRISDLYDELVADNATRMGTGAAEAAATRDTIAKLDAEAALKARRIGLTARAQAKMTTDMASFRDAGDGPIVARAAEAVLVRDDRAPYLSFEYRWKVIRGQAHALIDRVLSDHHANLIGRIRDREGFDRITDELHGTRTGDTNAAELADGIRQASEQLRLRANAAGADIGKLQDWGLPHSWHSERVESAGYDQWRSDIWPLLDRSRMIDRTTDKPFTDEALEPVLRDVFRAIETDGWSRRTPGGQGGSSLANRMGDHRFLHFKDGAAWRAIHDKYGVGNPYDALMGHIDQMSRDVALMETLGPNPAAGLKWLQDSVVKSAAERGTRAQRDQAARAAKKLQTLYDEATGALRDPYNRRVAMAFSTLRSWQTATKLGSATLSATTDFATTQLAKGYNGLPQTGTLLAYLRHLNPTSGEDRAHAIRSGLIAEEFANRTSAQGRYMGEELVGEVSRRVADGVLRASGLNAHTQALRFAFGKEFLAALTLYRVREWDGLPGAFRRSMEMGGISRAEWDGIRATPVTIERGAEWLDPAKIADRDVGERLMGRILAETDFAVPVAGLETGAVLHSNFRSGTILGELGRTAFQFKSFPVTITMMHARRMMAMSGWGERAGYMAALLILTTMAGATALQLKEIAKGKDPRPMDDPQFWGAAAAQGGGAGIYGDFLKGSQSRFGQSFTDVLAGPAWATIDTVNSLTLDAIGDAATKASDPDASDVRYGARVAQALKSEVPGGSLWYGRLAFERIVLDQIREQIDPNYRQSWRRMERLADEQGQEYYWRPGEAMPDRAPDFANVGGDE